MAVVTCKNYYIRTKRSNLKSISRTLVSFGGFEPIEHPFPIKYNDKDYKYNSQISDLLNNYNNLIERLKSIDIDINNNFSLSTNEINNYLNNFDELLKIYNYIDKEFVYINKSKKNIIKYEKKLKSIEKYKSIDFCINITHNLLDYIIFSSEVKIIENIKKDIKNTNIKIDQIKNDKEIIYFLIYDLNEKQTVEDIIKKHSIVLLDLSSFNKNETPEDTFLELKENIKNENKKILFSINKIKKMFSIHKKEVLICDDLLKFENDVNNFSKYWGIQSKISKEEKSNVSKEKIKEINNFLTIDKDDIQIEGWIDPINIKKMKEVLKEVDPNIEIEEKKAVDEEEVRSIIKNNNLFRPFEIVTTLMGTPSSKELDPSPFLSIFFIVFFGMALGDGGYGILMVFVSLYLLLTKKVKNDMKEAMKLVLYSGLSTIVFGAITG